MTPGGSEHTDPLLQKFYKSKTFFKYPWGMLVEKGVMTWLRSS